MYFVLQGNTATITDGMTNVETDLCTLLPEKTWVSEGSIVSIKFTPFVMGQGYSFTYHSLPLNNSISGNYFFAFHPRCKKVQTTNVQISFCLRVVCNVHYTRIVITFKTLGSQKKLIIAYI